MNQILKDGLTVTIERNSTHGDWVEQAACCYDIKQVFHNHPNWHKLNSSQQEAMDMIAVKQSRILSGNPNEPDHWLDIEGYASLVRRNLR